MAPLAPLCRAQARTARVGMLLFREGLRKEEWYNAFIAMLASRGWLAGRNLLLEHRFASEESSQFSSAAEALVKLDLDVLYATSAPATRAAHAATRTIPIVAQDYSNDPVAAGYAESYSRPGRNMTGVFLDPHEFAGKWLELLKAVVPGVKRIAVLWDPMPGAAHLDEVRRWAPRFGTQVKVYEVHAAKDFERHFATFHGWAQALIILPSPMTWNKSEQLAALALKHRLPATSVTRRFAEGGGAISYGPNFTETVQRNAIQVAKILDGAKPSDLPIERPTKFDLVVNMKTMQALRLEVPASLLPAAEQVGR
jgi:putative ABC transport system substrate-binding protein